MGRPMRLQVVPIAVPDELPRAFEAWWHVYGDDPAWVPPLESERRWFLDPDRNPWLRDVELQVFVALKGGAPVGTISAQLDPAGPAGVGYFGLFEFPDDEAVARCLLTTALGWIEGRGRSVARGPYNLSPVHSAGLSLSSSTPCLLDAHARSWYPRVYDRLNLIETGRSSTWWLDLTAPASIADVEVHLLRTHPDLTVRSMNPHKFAADMEQIVGVCSSGDRPCEELAWLAGPLRQVVEPQLVAMVFDGDRCIAASVTLPDVSPVLRKMKGRMFPFGWYHWWFGRQRVRALRLVMAAVAPSHRGRGLEALLYRHTLEAARVLGAEGLETPPVPTDDRRTRKLLRHLGAREHREYAAYERDTAADLTEDCPV